MASDTEITKLPPEDEADKDTVVVSVRLPDGEEGEKLVRRAAVEVDKTRSEFMADAAIEKAREVLKKQQRDAGAAA